MAVKEIICPHCKKNLSALGGYHHDENHTLLCTYCDGVVFPATKVAENKAKHSLAAASGNYTNWRKDCLPIKIGTNGSAPAATSRAPDCDDYDNGCD